jgi:hypothetical protein
LSSESEIEIFADQTESTPDETAVRVTAETASNSEMRGSGCFNYGSSSLQYIFPLVFLIFDVFETFVCSVLVQKTGRFIAIVSLLIRLRVHFRKEGVHDHLIFKFSQTREATREQNGEKNPKYGGRKSKKGKTKQKT